MLRGTKTPQPEKTVGKQCKRKQLTIIADMGIFINMIAKDGTNKEVRITRLGTQEKIGRLIYLESAMWDMYDRLAKDHNKTRSTFIRCELKDYRFLPKMEDIDWSETNTIK